MPASVEAAPAGAAWVPPVGAQGAARLAKAWGRTASRRPTGARKLFLAETYCSCYVLCLARNRRNTKHGRDGSEGRGQAAAQAVDPT